MAGLSLVLALALEVNPHFLMLDEVDAHLDADNTIMLRDYLKKMKSKLP